MGAMREILFRGKSVYDGRWIFGDLSNYGDCKTITTTRGFSIIDSCEAIPETVGQYTGLCDKNGTKIFEGDIVRYELHGIRNRAVIKYGAPKEDSACYGWYLDDNNGNTAFLLCKSWIKDYNCQVIGNIHDNPKLVEG